MKNTISKLHNHVIGNSKNSAKAAIVETKGAKTPEQLMFLPHFFLFPSKAVRGVHEHICRNYPETPTIDTSNQLRL